MALEKVRYGNKKDAFQVLGWFLLSNGTTFDISGERKKPFELAVSVLAWCFFSGGGVRKRIADVIDLFEGFEGCSDPVGEFFEEFEKKYCWAMNGNRAMMDYNEAKRILKKNSIQINVQGNHTAEVVFVEKIPDTWKISNKAMRDMLYDVLRYGFISPPPPLIYLEEE